MNENHGNSVVNNFIRDYAYAYKSGTDMHVWNMHKVQWSAVTAGSARPACETSDSINGRLLPDDGFTREQI